MNTVVTLNLKRVGLGGVPPAFAVADLIPISSRRDSLREPVRGVVLELRDGKKLRERVPVSAGPLVVNVKFPNGAFLSEQVEIVGDKPSVSFALADDSRRPTPRASNARDGVDVRHYHMAAAPSRTLWEEPKGAHGREQWRVLALPTADGTQLAVRSALEAIAPSVVMHRQANMGIVRLKGVELTAQAGAGEGAQTQLEAQAIVGRAEALQPVRLYGSTRSLGTQWKFPVRDTPGADYSEKEEGRHGRYFAVAYQVVERVHTHQIACIPGRWRRSDGKWASVHVRYDSESLRDSGRARVRIDVGDPEYGALLEFLQTGDIESSAAIFAKAKDGLRQKFTNPYAAAAGGYVILYSGLMDDALYWSKWIANLAHEFKALPDGAVLLATTLLQSRAGMLYEEHLVLRRRAALEAALDAVKRGPPLYRVGLSLMATNLQILKGIFRDDADDVKRIEQASDYVQALILRADPTQSFCVFDVEAEALE